MLRIVRSVVYKVCSYWPTVVWRDDSGTRATADRACSALQVPLPSLAFGEVRTGSPREPLIIHY
eukprot:1936870-Pyramimonas_sp.AAC.2